MNRVNMRMISQQVKRKQKSLSFTVLRETVFVESGFLLCCLGGSNRHSKE
jgi:hypothetical protein